MILTWSFVMFAAAVTAAHWLVVERDWITQRAAFALLPWLIIAAILEVGVRLFWPSAGAVVWPGYPEGLVITDPVLGHAYEPDFRGHFPQSRYANIPIAINAHGFRDRAWPDPNGESPRRVLVFGDSITFGSPIAAEARYSDVAESLSDPVAPRRFLNAGVNGYNIEQYRLLLEKIGDEVRPNAVLVGLCLNDAEPMARADQEVIDAARGRPSLSHRLRTYRMDLSQSYAWNLGRRAAMGRLYASPEWGPRLLARYDARVQRNLRDLYNGPDGPRRLRDELSRMRAVARERWGAPIAVLVFPYHSQIDAADSALPDTAARVVDEMGIAVHNLYDDFAAHKDEPGLYVHQDDCHPAEFGHHLAGEAAAALLTAAGL